MCGQRPNNYEIYKSRRWGDCTFARASPVSLSRKPLSPDIEATSKRLISFGLARSSPNMASYWYIYVTGRLRNPCVCKHPRVYANTRPNQGVCIHPRAFANALGCLQTPGSFRVFAYTLGCFKRPRLFANTLRNRVQRSHHLVLYRLIRGLEDRREYFGVSVCPFHESTELFKLAHFLNVYTRAIFSHSPLQLINTVMNLSEWWCPGVGGGVPPVPGAP